MVRCLHFRSLCPAHQDDDRRDNFGIVVVRSKETVCKR